jgi:heat shock protein HtpX
MWEAIAANQRRSRVLICLMAVLLLITGAAIGLYVEPRYGAQAGAAIALLVWLIMTVTALLAGDSILLASAGARQVQKEDAPQLWNVVEEMTIAAGLGKVPAIYVIDDGGMNAFAVGRRPEKAAVAVTSGLLKRLNRDELQGVIGHEIGHIRNLDIRFMTLASVLVGSIVMLSDTFMRLLRYGSISRRSSRRDSGDGGGGNAVFLLIALAVAILAPIAAQMLYFACSRRREYLADASSARFTRYPAGLASALEKISTRADVMAVNQASAPLYIINPLNAAGDEGLFSTHPPLLKRIAILQSMGGEAGLAGYEAAFHQVTGDKKSLLRQSTLAGEVSVPVREASVEPDDLLPKIGANEIADPLASGPRAEVRRVQQVTDMLARLGDYLILPCVCGLKIKLPPEFRGDSVTCPRCGREQRIPEAQLMAALATLPAAAQAAGAVPADQQVLQYRRQAGGWESFKCACGQTQQLSPNFAGQRITCRKCGRTIEIEQ